MESTPPWNLLAMDIPKIYNFSKWENQKAVALIRFLRTKNKEGLYPIKKMQPKNLTYQ